MYEQLLKENARLIRFGAKRFGIGLDPDDALQVGRIALWKSSGKYRPDSGMKFSTYAVQSIHFALSHERQKNNSSVAMVSLDDPGPAGDGSMVDFIPDRSAVDPSENAASSEIRGRVAVALQNLKVTDAGIVRQYFGIGARQSTLEEIARSAGVTKQRISFVLKRSLKRLRPCLTVVVD